MSSPDIEFPEPTEEEQQLQSEQVELLRLQAQILQQQIREQNLLAPFAFEAIGIQPVFDPETGQITSFERLPEPEPEPEPEPTEEDLLRQDIERQLLERSQAALSGTLPVSPALERALAEEEATLRGTLFRQLGPGFETSTPGIETLGNFARRSEELREGTRRGELALAEGLSLARQESRERAEERAALAAERADVRNFGRLGNILGQRLSIPSAINPTLGGFQAILGNLAANRQNQFQAAAFNASQPTLGGQLLNTATLLGAAALGGGVNFRGGGQAAAATPSLGTSVFRPASFPG